MLPKLATDLLWIDYKKRADMASARGGAEQIGLLEKLNAAEVEEMLEGLPSPTT